VEGEKCEHQLKLYIDGKSETKRQIYTVQQDAAIERQWKRCSLCFLCRDVIGRTN
jgi:hypothetical protein